MSLERGNDFFITLLDHASLEPYKARQVPEFCKKESVFFENMRVEMKVISEWVPENEGESQRIASVCIQYVFRGIIFTPLGLKENVLFSFCCDFSF